MRLFRQRLADALYAAAWTVEPEPEIGGWLLGLGLLAGGAGVLAVMTIAEKATRASRRLDQIDNGLRHQTTRLNVIDSEIEHARQQIEIQTGIAGRRSTGLEVRIAALEPKIPRA